MFFIFLKNFDCKIFFVVLIMQEEKWRDLVHNYDNEHAADWAMSMCFV